MGGFVWYGSKCLSFCHMQSSVSPLETMSLFSYAKYVKGQFWDRFFSSYVLLDNAHRHGVNFLCYADDTQLYVNVLMLDVKRKIPHLNIKLNKRISEILTLCCIELSCILL